MPTTKSWMSSPEYTHREDHPDPLMRPSYGRLVTKLKNLNSLKDHPEAVERLIHDLAHKFFVAERQRPDHAFLAMRHLKDIWDLALNSPYNERNDRQLESASNAISSEDEMEKLSLPPTRNDTTPGPSHKSPVAYAGAMVGTGFTIPGVEGRFIWHGTDVMMKPPDMDRVVDLLAAGLAAGSAGEARRSPDLGDKGLKKRVRQVIQEHQYAPYQNRKGLNIPNCTCDNEFEDLEGWSIHVRKLIWKELKHDASA